MLATMQQAAAAATGTGLTAIGWIFMLVSTLSMTGLTIWCFKQVLAAPDEPDLPPGLGP